MSQSSEEVERNEIRLWLPVSSNIGDRPNVSRDDVENEFEIPLLYIYYTSRTFIVLCTIFIVLLGATYIAQAFYTIDQLPGQIASIIVKEFGSSKCNPSIDDSCPSDRPQCNVGGINTCVGGNQPPGFIP